MTKEQLQERINKAQAKVKKIEKRISKWQNAMNSESCLKHYDYLLGWGRTNDQILSQCYDGYIKDCERELKYANNDLSETKLIIEKYQNLLNLELAKENEFENNRIFVIWEFLLKYKERVAKHIRDNMSVLNEWYEVNSQICDWHNNNSYKVYNGEMTREEYNRVYNELNERERELSECIHPYTKEVATRDYSKEDSAYVVDEPKLEELLTKDCKAKYFELVNQVTKITGTIIDATNLAIRAGELNGIIIGEKGKAKVQTFSAGGHSTHIIVNEKHGQCFHYRTRVDRVD